MSKKNSIRALCHTAVLWLDNPAMLHIYNYLRYTTPDERGFYFLGIHHKAEQNEKKDHVHTMFQFSNARTADGVRKSFGVDRVVWRLAYMEIATSVEQKLVRMNPDDSIFNAEYQRVEKWKNSESWVLLDDKDPESFVETPYIDGQLVCREYCPDNCIWRLVPIYNIPHVETVSDKNSLAVYLLHRDPQSLLEGKKTVYEMCDFFGDQEFIKSCFPPLKSPCKESLIDDVQSYIVQTGSLFDLLRIANADNRTDVVEYVEKHGFLVQQMFKDCRYKAFKKIKRKV